MRRALVVLVVVAVCSVAMAVPSGRIVAEELVVGTWTGSWAGESSGTYTMTIERGEANALTGTLDVSPDDDAGYTAAFSSIVFDADRLTMHYRTPTGDDVELDATIDEGTLDGTWQVFAPGSRSVVANGTFTGTKQ